MDFILKGIFTLAMIASASSAGVVHTCRGFVPSNTMHIGIDDKAAGGLTEEEFIQILTEAEEAFTPIFSRLGGNLAIYGNWRSGEVNAAAGNRGNENLVIFYGGLARHPETTMDSFRLTVCHEMGHHIGGAPTYRDGMSSEGQADYYAGIKCMKYLLRGKEQVEILDSPNVPPRVLEKCQDIYSTKEEQAVCVRTHLAGLAAGRLFASLNTRAILPNLDTPSRLVVRRTNVSYATPQCRTDTFVAGANCNKAGEPYLSRRTSQQAEVCIQSIDDDGFRPACWFKQPTL
jgi:hypothetical protein